MNRKTKLSLVLVTALGLAGASVYAAGQSDGPCAKQGPGMHQGKGHGPRHGGQFDAARMEQRMERMKQELKITAEQESAWQGFTNARKQHVQQRQAHHAQMQALRAQAAEQTPAQRMQPHVVFMEERLEQMKAAADELGKFYAVLTPEQQEIANRLFARKHKGARRL